MHYQPLNSYSSQTNDSLFCSLSFTLPSLFTLGLKFVGSRRNVISRLAKNWFMPVSRLCGGVAVALMAGCPSKTMTRSARYVAMMKSCSITKAVFFACRMKRLMTFEAIIRCSESRKLGVEVSEGQRREERGTYDEGSSMR